VLNSEGGGSHSAAVKLQQWFENIPLTFDKTVNSLICHLNWLITGAISHGGIPDVNCCRLTSDIPHNIEYRSNSEVISK